MMGTLRFLGIVTGSVSRQAGGLFNSVRQSALALTAAGLDVDVFGLEDGYTREDRAAWQPIEPKTARCVGPSAIGFAPGNGLHLRRSNHDVLHQHGIWQAFSAQVSSWHRRTGRPYMISPRGMLDPWALQNSGWKKRISGALFARRHLEDATCMHALNESEAQSIRDIGLLQPIAIIPNGVELPKRDPLPRPREWPQRKALLFMGRLHPKKGVMELVRAWSKAGQRSANLFQEWVLVIAGWDDGGHGAQVKAGIGRLGLEDNVHMPGALIGDAKRAAFSHASALVLPSYSEGLPMSVLEAWSYGLPVLMTDECHIAQGFSEGAAYRIDNDVDALAAQLEIILGAPDDCLGAMGKAGQRLVETHFNWSSIAAEHLEVYRWLVNGSPLSDRPDCVLLEKNLDLASAASNGDGVTADTKSATSKLFSFSREMVV
ncbi:MAG: glycosyltransferase [Pseudomonadota bacterium]